MRIAILALQGAFAEHQQMLHSLGVETFQVRNKGDWEKPKDGLILPGGESTTMTKLLNELDLLLPIQEEISQGLPVFGTCAGLIMLARKENGKPSNRLSTMDIDVCRNAYGRQLGSFHTEEAFKGIEGTVPMTFIRAPYINEVFGDAEILATVDGNIVAAKQHHQMVTAFHPELDNDTRVHAYFLNSILKR